MINIDLSVDSESVFHTIKVRGHDKKTPCTAVSVLLRTLGRLLEPRGEDELKAEIHPTSAGFLDITLLAYSINRKGWLQGLTDFIIIGLQDVVSDYPDSVKVNIQETIENERR